MAGLTWSNQLRHWLIRSRWKRWLFPVLCAIPYLGSLLWLMGLQQGWIAQVMLTPLLMMASWPCSPGSPWFRQTLNLQRNLRNRFDHVRVVLTGSTRPSNRASINATAWCSSGLCPVDQLSRYERRFGQLTQPRSARYTTLSDQVVRGFHQRSVHQHVKHPRTPNGCCFLLLLV